MVTSVVGFQFSWSHYHFTYFYEIVYIQQISGMMSQSRINWNGFIVSKMSNFSRLITTVSAALLCHLHSMYVVRWSSHTGHTLEKFTRSMNFIRTTRFPNECNNRLHATWNQMFNLGLVLRLIGNPNWIMCVYKSRCAETASSRKALNVNKCCNKHLITDLYAIGQ